MSTMTAAVVASLSTQQAGPLGKRRAAHLLRRCSFHISKERVDQLALLTADQAVNLLFDTPSPAPYMVRPLFNRTAGNGIEDWIDLDTNSNEFFKRRTVASWWLRNAIFDQTAHHKVAFFLHTLFSTGTEGLSITGTVNGVYQSLSRDVSRFSYDHVRLLAYLTNNGTSLKTICRKITLDNLMLGYLNNRRNFASGVNENFAREFFELFTIGPGALIAPGEFENYFETDITIAAQVFSGFSTSNRRNLSDIDPDTGIPKGKAYPNLHTTGDKQFSAKFAGANNPVMGEVVPTEAGMYTELDQFIDMVFDQPATALNYANKMYRFFIGIELDTVFAQEVADDLSMNGFDYIDTLRKLLKSEHFYSICDPDPNFSNGNIIKSPIEMVSEAYSFFQGDLPPFVDINNPTEAEVRMHFYRFSHVFLFTYYGIIVGQRLLSPPNVAGYPAYWQEPDWDKSWYNPGTLPTRYGLGTRLVIQNNLGLSVDANIDTVAYADYLAGLGIDVSDANAVLDETLCIFPQEVSADRRTLILDIFLDNLSPINWMFLWNCYSGTGFCPPGSLPPGDSSGIRPHLNALVQAVLSANEFQLK